MKSMQNTKRSGDIEPAVLASVSWETSDRITHDEYLRERLQPRPGDIQYIHLSDLLLAISRFATQEPLSILDFGCGGSPYRSLFPNAKYERADIAGTPDIDYVIPSVGTRFELPIPDQTFDLIISSQVLEHVLSPENYLREAFRLVRPGGRMILTTHGTYSDHGCPYDYRRWTDAGLRVELENVGFNVTEIMKLTTCGRAIALLFQEYRGTLSRRTPMGLFLRTCAEFANLFRGTFNKQCDKAFRKNRVVTENLEEHRAYIGLLAVGCSLLK